MHGLRCVFAFVCFLAAPVFVQAQQASVYGTADLSLFEGRANSNVGYQFHSDKFGFVVGGFYNFAIDSRFKPGIDVRLVEGPSQTGGTAALAALRVSFVPHRNPLRPYVEIGGGVISAANNYNSSPGSSRQTTGGLEIDFGLDIRLTRRLDLRLPDYGAAAGSRAGTAWFGSGLVYHFE